MNWYSRLAENIIKITAHLIFPVECPVCGTPGEIICGECLKKLFSSETIKLKNNGGLKIYSGNDYDVDIIKKSIHNLKYNKVSALGKPLGKFLAGILTRPDDLDYIIPVPLHIGSEREYNQSYEIARGFYEEWRVKILNAAVWSKYVQRRVMLNAAERLALSDDAFKIIADVKNKNVVLIDDITTTGTTLLKLKQALEKSGANVLSAYTLAC